MYDIKAVRGLTRPADIMEWYRSGHNEHDWKSCDGQKPSEGSNPSHSAKIGDVLSNIADLLFIKGKHMLNKFVTVTVDRPLGSFHPKHPDLYYPVNYGYINGVMAPDGEEQDAYILGVSEPVEEFTGRVIAIIHRYDDIEEKWVVAPESMRISADEIMQQVSFQEQFFQSEVRMI